MIESLSRLCLIWFHFQVQDRISIFRQKFIMSWRQHRCLEMSPHIIIVNRSRISILCIFQCSRHFHEPIHQLEPLVMHSKNTCTEHSAGFLWAISINLSKWNFNVGDIWNFDGKPPPVSRAEYYKHYVWISIFKNVNINSRISRLKIEQASESEPGENGFNLLHFIDST